MYKLTIKLYGGPIGHAMCQLPCNDVQAMIDDVDVTIDDVRCVNVIIIRTCARPIHGLRAAKETPCGRLLWPREEKREG